MKYYQVIKENFLWEVGAILKQTSEKSDFSGYQPINEVFLKHPNNPTEYISKGIVENCPEYFQQVYKVETITKAVYLVKEKALELIGKDFKQ